MLAIVRLDPNLLVDGIGHLPATNQVDVSAQTSCQLARADQTFEAFLWATAALALAPRK
jgi:hypothetical protein